ncbi:MAG: hypothetical protein M0C28_29415 [Candidatus Moduliflexus flocculans]|nr:hypothetical protein [Candidatus Moduliflexus flocculans]
MNALGGRLPARRRDLLPEQPASLRRQRPEQGRHAPHRPRRFPPRSTSSPTLTPNPYSTPYVFTTSTPFILDHGQQSVRHRPVARRASDRRVHLWQRGARIPDRGGHPRRLRRQHHRAGERTDPPSH